MSWTLEQRELEEGLKERRPGGDSNRGGGKQTQLNKKATVN